ncbi:MAG: hypothetical protein U5L45_09355 [Saprospiraceae bacterium]|nr:hypothetical protein [Saprospiraceae bacterium]
MVRFRLRRKTNHVSSLLRERSERKTSVFNQKNDVFRLCPLLTYLAHSSLRSREGGDGSFFGLCPKNEPPLPRASEASAD